jgi:NAD(P)-dependent dehydrogenase (short-subunit alcohol dehydrogenase family)
MTVSFTRAAITGAANGLGRAFVLELSRRQRGAKILVGDIDIAGAETTAKDACAIGADARAVKCDVAKEGDVAALAEEMDRAFGGTDLVVNNAGVATTGEMGDVKLDDWRWIVSINLMGVIHGCHFFAPRFRAQRSGTIINISSAAGLFATAEMAPYNATKFAVVGLSESLYLELKPHGVGVTVVCPMFFPTNIVTSARRNGPSQNDKVAAALMAESKFTADDIARMSLRAGERRELYCVPMNEGKALWAAKRAWPEGFYGHFAPRVAAHMRKRFLDE